MPNSKNNNKDKKKEIELFVVLDDGKSHSISYGTSYNTVENPALPTVVGNVEYILVKFIDTSEGK